MENEFLKKVIMPAGAGTLEPDENLCGSPVLTSVLLGAVSP